MSFSECSHLISFYLSLSLFLHHGSDFTKIVTWLGSIYAPAIMKGPFYYSFACQRRSRARFFLKSPSHFPLGIPFESGERKETTRREERRSRISFGRTFPPQFLSPTYSKERRNQDEEKEEAFNRPKNNIRSEEAGISKFI